MERWDVEGEPSRFVSMNEPILSQPPRAVTMLGATLGSYRITGALGTGGMGRVFRAQHSILGRPAAVKLLRPELTENAELVQRFFNEAKAATAIRHPGIVEIYDFGYTPEGNAYLVMELLEGRTLADALASVGRFTELEAASIARGLASTLKAAHSKGIVHRDLKPDNVFLIPDVEGPTGSTRVKVLDFGVAKLAGNSTLHGASSSFTQTGILLGTVSYMAPEQARAAAEIDHRADLYSVGCILYELLVGEPPFVGEGAGEIIAMQMFTAPVSPRERVADISIEMEAIVLRLLAKEPTDRFQSAAELGRALAAIRGAPIGASAPHSAVTPGSRTYAAPSMAERDALPTEVTPKPRSRAPVVALVSTVVLLIAAIVVFALIRASSTNEASADEPPAAPAPTKPALETPPQTPTPRAAPEAPPAPSPPAPSPAPSSSSARPALPATPPKPTASTQPHTVVPSPAPPNVEPKGPTTSRGNPIEWTP
jgi:serine/threonine-protein kinase